MNKTMISKCMLISTAGISVSLAENYELSIEIPRLKVSEYHKPYVASWIEDSDRKHQLDVLLWYRKGSRATSGTRWLKDMRKWWRQSGRQLDFPVDGFSGPTKGPGKHKIPLKQSIDKLASGQYTLLVEAAREVGGREVVSIPFSWDGKEIRLSPDTVSSGDKELGDVSIKQTK